jgi:hypothetical protein
VKHPFGLATTGVNFVPLTHTPQVGVEWGVTTCRRIKLLAGSTPILRTGLGGNTDRVSTGGVPEIGSLWDAAAKTL